MNELTLHPNVYATGQSKGLVSLLERVWVRDQKPGDGIIYVVSGFANYNGGVRFYETFRQHSNKGGKIVAVFSGSSQSHLTSKQVVTEMLNCGATVHIINRKRLLHAKCYGVNNKDGDSIVLTSGNFTGPGMSQNAEISVLLDHLSTSAMNFSWNVMINKVLEQNWDFYQPTLINKNGPGWQLLYDEQARDITLDDSEEVTMILRLSHSDTVRIMSSPGTVSSKGTQYFWLSKDCYDFFPPLTIRNIRGSKATYSCPITMEYMDLNITDPSCRVTFEAENNLDFRLGTGKLRNTKIATEGDIAAISRVSETVYQMRIYKKGTQLFQQLNLFAINFIGHQGKKYGYLSNQDFVKIVGKRLN